MNDIIDDEDEIFHVRNETLNLTMKNECKRYQIFIRQLSEIPPNPPIHQQ
jgi:hypothetical protein